MYGAHYCFIREGMTELMTFYNLCSDAWILFDYIGESRFNIMIEDGSGKDIVYPIRRDCRNQQQPSFEPSPLKSPNAAESPASNSLSFSVVLTGPQSGGSQLV